MTSRSVVAPVTVANVPIVENDELSDESAIVMTAFVRPEYAVTCRCATAPVVEDAPPSTEGAFPSAVAAPRSCKHTPRSEEPSVCAARSNFTASATGDDGANEVSMPLTMTTSDPIEKPD